MSQKKSDNSRLFVNAFNALGLEFRAETYRDHDLASVLYVLRNMPLPWEYLEKQRQKNPWHIQLLRPADADSEEESFKNAGGFATWCKPEGSDIIQIGDFFIREKHRGQGLARYLLEEVYKNHQPAKAIEPLEITNLGFWKHMQNKKSIPIIINKTEDNEDDYLRQKNRIVVDAFFSGENKKNGMMTS